MLPKRILFTGLFFLLFAIPAHAETYSLAELTKYAEKIVPKGWTQTNADADDRSAFMAYENNGKSLQITLSADKESQMQIEDQFKVDGKKADFFRPMDESSGAVFILINDHKSLSIVYMAGFLSDEEVSVKGLQKMTKGLKF